jgi:DNA-binding transcriptional LysR family regulator
MAGPTIHDVADIELRHLRYFVAVAEEGSFTHAAGRLFIAQPSLSYTIRQLEDRVGVELVDRADRRRLVLTDAGEAMLAHAREILAGVEAAVTAVRAVARREKKALTVGYADGEPLARRPGALGTASRYAGLTVAFRRLSWGSEAEALRSGAVDALLLRLPVDLPGAVVETLAEEPRAVCLPAGHRLAGRARVTLGDLAGEAVVVPTGGPPEWVAFWRGIPRPDGSVPPDGPATFGPEDTFEAVSQGLALCFIPASMAATIQGDEIVTAVVTDLEPVRTALAWRGTPRPAVRAFAEAARTLLAASRTWTAGASDRHDGDTVRGRRQGVKVADVAGQDDSSTVGRGRDEGVDH